MAAPAAEADRRRRLRLRRPLSPAPALVSPDRALAEDLAALCRLGLIDLSPTSDGDLQVAMSEGVE